ncbi:hypothetical protein IFM46972_06494 [Aspergillus udagawae]|uniref:Uncharacterized protein n=1 Tax=Aspergillus udagawae TaxID=91492 RepID=A0A8H3P1M8_9EURO|nr:hypothetical protein IFM46972_06494 [Aspergillus udagawae]
MRFSLVLNERPVYNHLVMNNNSIMNIIGDNTWLAVNKTDDGFGRWTLADDAAVLQLPSCSTKQIDGSSTTLHHQLQPTSTR